MRLTDLLNEPTGAERAEVNGDTTETEDEHEDEKRSLVALEPEQAFQDRARSGKERPFDFTQGPGRADGNVTHHATSLRSGYHEDSPRAPDTSSMDLRLESEHSEQQQEKDPGSMAMVDDGNNSHLIKEKLQKEKQLKVAKEKVSKEKVEKAKKERVVKMPPKKKASISSAAMGDLDFIEVATPTTAAEPDLKLSTQPPQESLLGSKHRIEEELHVSEEVAPKKSRLDEPSDVQGAVKAPIGQHQGKTADIVAGLESIKLPGSPRQAPSSGRDEDRILISKDAQEESSRPSSGATATISHNVSSTPSEVKLAPSPALKEVTKAAHSRSSTPTSGSLAAKHRPHLEEDSRHAAERPKKAASEDPLLRSPPPSSADRENFKGAKPSPGTSAPAKEKKPPKKKHASEMAPAEEASAPVPAPVPTPVVPAPVVPAPVVSAPVPVPAPTTPKASKIPGTPQKELGDSDMEVAESKIPGKSSTSSKKVSSGTPSHSASLKKRFSKHPEDQSGPMEDLRHDDTLKNGAVESTDTKPSLDKASSSDSGRDKSTKQKRPERSEVPHVAGAKSEGSSKHQQSSSKSKEKSSLLNIKSTKEDPGAREATIEPKQGDEDSNLYCICRTLYDPSRFMIECDGCDDWFHGDCVGVAEKDSEMVDKYYCKSCEGTYVLSRPLLL